MSFRQNNRDCLLTISTSAAAPEGEKALRANDPASNAAAKQGNSDRLASLRIQLLYRSLFLSPFRDAEPREPSVPSVLICVQVFVRSPAAVGRLEPAVPP